MLICNNCFSENADHTVRCTQCNMADNFSYQVPEGSMHTLLIGDKNPLQCNNCGSQAPGEGHTCIHCHFPMPEDRKQNGQSLFPHAYKQSKTG